jgi:hypothetical protein
VRALEADQAEKAEHVQQLLATTKEKIWRADLDAFETAYKEWLEEEYLESCKQPQCVASRSKKGKHLRVLCLKTVQCMLTE